MKQVMGLYFLVVFLSVAAVSDAGPLFGRRARPASQPSILDSNDGYIWPTRTYTFEGMSCDHGMYCVGGTFGGSVCSWRFEFYGNRGMRLSIINENGDKSSLRGNYRVFRPGADGRVRVEIPCYQDPQAMISLDWSPSEDRCYNARLQSN